MLMVFKDLRESPALPVHKVRLVLMESQVHKALPGFKVRKALPVLKVRPDLREQQE